MSLTIYKFQLEHFPHYILNSLNMTTSSSSTFSSSPSPHFILHPITIISNATTESLASDTILNGVDTLAMPLSAKHTQETPLQAQVGRSWF